MISFLLIQKTLFLIFLTVVLFTIFIMYFASDDYNNNKLNSKNLLLTEKVIPDFKTILNKFISKNPKHLKPLGQDKSKPNDSIDIESPELIVNTEKWHNRLLGIIIIIITIIIIILRMLHC